MHSKQCRDRCFGGQQPTNSSSTNVTNPLVLGNHDPLDAR